MGAIQALWQDDFGLLEAGINDALRLACKTDDQRTMAFAPAACDCERCAPVDERRLAALTEASCRLEVGASSSRSASVSWCGVPPPAGGTA